MGGGEGEERGRWEGESGGGEGRERGKGVLLHVTCTSITSLCNLY